MNNTSAAEASRVLAANETGQKPLNTPSAFSVCWREKRATCDGRANRAEFWNGSGSILLLMIFLTSCFVFLIELYSKFLLTNPTVGYEAMALAVPFASIAVFVVLCVFCLPPMYCVAVRRMHDIGRGGSTAAALWAFPVALFWGSFAALLETRALTVCASLCLLAMLLFFVFLILAAKKGNPEANKYGAPPAEF